ncbi:MULTISPECIES: DUF2127 domain-containing protein [unclassified Dehalobacter]|uniref:DUF2127 domain-containing protein n=1 Tax=unclassified Dehalobacter TaxID=2635733 RepID=UPI000E6D2EA9|nr:MULTISPECIES: DUF2127 domain-containing protein [unclassified Dehalobacter]RJE49287.1 hypothetical protein A7K50_07185 [Dehalobacter sp. MCB1]TCX53336.1 DUF2127 domain-containing protein [Dehalobacter sp. 14DCB1]TCX54350.1 DUF2127 domain-containing protein [Dehalobacter sp. 12DCB1]
MTTPKTNKQKDIFHIGFKIGLLMKGIDGLLEIIGSILLLFLTPDRYNWLIRLLTQHELSEDPQDLFANYLIHSSPNFSFSTQHFVVFYLLSHGIIKCILVLLLWRQKLWAYPLAILSLILFVVYQLYRYTFTHSAFLILLTIFDVLMIFLTYKESKQVRSRLCDSV